LITQRFQFSSRILGKRDFVIAFKVNDHRLQNTLFAAMDGTDHPSTRRGEQNAWRFLVGEQYLSQFDPIPNLNVHARLHAGVIGPYDSNAAHQPSRFYTLRWCTRYGQIKPMVYFDH